MTIKMGKPAARIGDMHTCPMATGSTPHVGGPVVGPTVPGVFISGAPAAVMGDTCTCVGPPDTIVMGSTGVFIGGKPAARQGDMTGHGGVISVGCSTVFIGEIRPGSIAPPDIKPFFMNAMANMAPEAQLKAAQIATLMEAAKNGTPLCEKCKH